jgi:hypothetical protein
LLCLQHKIRLHFEPNSVILDSDVLEHTPMNLLLLSSVGIFVLLGIVFLALFRKLSSGNRRQVHLGDLEQLFAPSRYKPMERLLDPADGSFLAAQPACTRSMARRFRARRLGIFRGYARCLGRDFTRVSNALKMLMVHAPMDRSELAGLLLKQRLLFSVAMMSLQFRLVLHGFGWSAPNVEVRNLVEALDAMRTQLRALALTVQPSASAA